MNEAFRVWHPRGNGYMLTSSSGIWSSMQAVCMKVYHSQSWRIYVNCAPGVLSHQLKKHVIDGNRTIICAETPEEKVQPFESFWVNYGSNYGLTELSRFRDLTSNESCERSCSTCIWFVWAYVPPESHMLALWMRWRSSSLSWTRCIALTLLCPPVKAGNCPFPSLFLISSAIPLAALHDWNVSIFADLDARAIVWLHFL